MNGDAEPTIAGHRALADRLLAPLANQGSADRRTNAAVWLALSAALALVVILLGIAAPLTAIVLWLSVALVLAPRLLAPIGGAAGSADGLARIEQASQEPAWPRPVTPHESPGELARRAGASAAMEMVDSRRMIDALADPAMLIDALGNVLHTNPPLVTLFPRTRLGLPYSLANRAPELIEAVDKVVPGRPLSVAIEVRVPVRRRLLAMVGRLEAVTPETLPDPGRPAVIIVFRDVSEQERLAEMRADFIANASHELRTPLASLRGFVETLQGPAREDPAARARFLALMAAQAARMTRLIDDLLSLSRVEMRMHVPPAGTVDLEDVAAFVVQSLEPMRSEAGATLSVTREPGDLRVRGDREELVQVVQNLVQNALKYGRRGGCVSIGLSRMSAGDDHSVLLTVKDDGPGIPPEHLPRLTERFYRVNAAASRDKGGTGLGLAIVKNIVNRHRGELLIASRPGEGATFTVRLPSL